MAHGLDGDGTAPLSVGGQSVDRDVSDSAEFGVKVERETPSGGGAGELSLELGVEWDENGGDDGPLTVE